VQHAADVSVKAHKAAWQRIAPGLHEYQVAATMSNVYFEAGCERHAYPPIVASGPKSIILHYNENKRRMDGGELLLMDVGSECSMYAADITRTVPVSGKFTARQREVYTAVLGAADAAIAAAKPGVTFSKLNDIAREHLRQAGSSKSGKTFDNYAIHFLGHGVGLEVHDPLDRQIPLEAGMILTIEPGVYIPEEGIGVRIEDMILITKDGARNMTADLPRDPAAIEKAMAARAKPHH
jgi:Xaa-Pro aminopeptidase